MPHQTLADLRRNAARQLAGLVDQRRATTAATMAREEWPLAYRQKEATRLRDEARQNLDGAWSTIRARATAARTLLMRDRVQRIGGTPGTEARIEGATKRVLRQLREAGDGWQTEAERIADRAIELGFYDEIEALRRELDTFRPGQEPDASLMDKVHDASGIPEAVQAGEALRELDAGMKNLELTYSHLRGELADVPVEAPIVANFDGSTIARLDPAMPAHTRAAIEAAATPAE